MCWPPPDWSWMCWSDRERERARSEGPASSDRAPEGSDMTTQLGSRPAVTAGRSVRASDAARLMRDRNIGAVVVVEGTKPIGIVTDRDIVTRIIAAGKDPAGVTVGEIMTEMPAVVNENVGFHEALK